MVDSKTIAMVARKPYWGAFEPFTTTSELVQWDRQTLEAAITESNNVLMGRKQRVEHFADVLETDAHETVHYYQFFAFYIPHLR